MELMGLQFLWSLENTQTRSVEVPTIFPSTTEYQKSQKLLAPKTVWSVPLFLFIAHAVDICLL